MDETGAPAVCGDGVCDVGAGEACVACPEDCGDSAWAIETIAADVTFCPWAVHAVDPAVVVDSTGRVHALYIAVAGRLGEICSTTTRDLTHAASTDDGGWEASAPLATDAREADLAIDASDGLHTVVAIEEPDAGNWTVAYGHAPDAQSWDGAVLARSTDSYDVQSPAIAIDANGTRHITYGEFRGVTLAVPTALIHRFSDDGETWSFDNVGAGAGSNLRFDSDGGAHVLLFGVPGKLSAGIVHHGERPAGEQRWSTPSLVDEGQTIVQGRVAVTDDGAVHAAYAMSLFGSRLGYAVREPGEPWSAETLAVSEVNDGESIHAALEVDGMGGVHLFEAKDDGSVHYWQRPPAAAWSKPVLLDPLVLTEEYSSVVRIPVATTLDAAGRLHVLYVNPEALDLRHGQRCVG